MIPDCYSGLLKLKAFRSMVDFIGDGGCDTVVGRDVLSLFKELTKEDQDGMAKLFVDLLLTYNPLPIFVCCLIRLSDDSANDEVVSSTFGIMVNMIIHRPSVADSLIGETQLCKWIMDKLQDDICDDNKRAAAAILRILLEFSGKKQIKLGGMNVKQAVVKTIFPYASSTCYPSFLDKDMLNHLCDCLYWLLEPVPNEWMFPDAGGVELMVSIIKNENLVYFHEYAIEMLKIALTTCKKFVDAAFPTSTGESFSSDMLMEGENEGHLIISLLAILFGCTGEDARIDSMLVQYMENNLEIIAWLMDLYKRYSSKVTAVESELEDQKLIVDSLGHLWHSMNDAIRNKIKQLQLEQKTSTDNVMFPKGMMTTNQKKRKRE